MLAAFLFWGGGEGAKGRSTKHFSSTRTCGESAQDWIFPVESSVLCNVNDYHTYLHFNIILVYILIHPKGYLCFLTEML